MLPILWNPKAYCRAHKMQTTVSVLCQINPIHPGFNVTEIRFNINLTFMPWSFQFSFPFRLFNQTFLHIPQFSMCDICSAHFILLELLNLTIHAEGCKPWSYKMCNFLQPSVNSPLLDSNILLPTLFSNTFTLYCSLYVTEQV